MSSLALGEPRILPRPEHPVSRRSIDENALKVLYRLHRAGFKAYLVGGSVRDLMLGRRPKDFDVGTDARPNQIRRLFRNARIIGRRFRLAHILFREGVIEVSTFRRDPDPRHQSRDPGELLVTSDNTFGTPREDAFRRDFTVNALFYNIADYSVIDYVGGIDDLERRVIRVIGEPRVRFQEDPVRMLRACEFAARLGFTIHRDTQESIQEQWKLLEKAAPARLTEELVQLLKCGQAGAALQWMLDLGLLKVLLPEAYAMLSADERGIGDFSRILPVLDEMVAAERELTDTMLLAAVLVPGLLLRRYEMEAEDRAPIRGSGLQQLVQEVAGPFFARLPFANLKAQQVYRSLETFHLLCDPPGPPAQRLRLVNRPHFDDALLLLEILVSATGEGQGVLEPWKEASRRRHHRREAPTPARQRPRRRRRRRRRQ